MGGVVKSRERQARADSAPVSTGFRQPKNTELDLREGYMLCARRELKQKFRLTNQTRSHACSYKTSRPKLDYVGFNSQEVGNAS